MLLMGKKALATAVLILLSIALLTYLDVEGLLNPPVKLPWSKYVKDLLSKLGVRSGTTTTEVRNTTVPTTSVSIPTKPKVSTSEVVTTEVRTTEVSNESVTIVTTKQASVIKNETTTSRAGGEAVGSEVIKEVVKRLKESKLGTYESLRKAARNIINYYRAVKDEDLRISKYFDLSVVDNESLIKLHKALYEAYDIKELRVSNLTCSFVSNDVIGCSYVVHVVLIDRSGKSLTQVNNLVTLTNRDGLIIQTVRSK